MDESSMPLNVLPKIVKLPPQGFSFLICFPPFKDEDGWKVVSRLHNIGLEKLELPISPGYLQELQRFQYKNYHLPTRPQQVGSTGEEFPVQQFQVRVLAGLYL